MSNSVLSIIIIAVAIILFVTEKIPISVTAIGAAVAMAVFGVIPYSTAFAGFSSDVTIMIFGAMIIGESLFETGAAQKIGVLLLKVVRSNEKAFLILAIIVSAVLSAFLSNLAVVAMMLPIAATASAVSNGKIQKKYTYMAIGFAANVGGGMTLVGAMPNIIGQGLLEATNEPLMSFFDLTWVSLPRFGFMVLFYYFIGYRLQKKIFTFPELETAIEDGDIQKSNPVKPAKMILSIVILLLMITGFIVQIWTLGTVAMVAGLVCIITNCISIQRAFETMDWTTVWVLAGSLGFAAGLDQSGGGKLIANAVIHLFGDEISYFALLILFTVLGVLLGNLMSSSAAIAMLGPIAITLCQEFGYDSKNMIMALVLSINLAFATPISTAPITMTLRGGYRFNDYIKFGGILTLIMTIVTILSYPFFFL